MELTLFGRPLNTLSEADFTRHVNAAFKNYHSVLALSRSPLANSTLVTPVLILDSFSSAADRRGRALQLVLQWAVSYLAPEPVRYPLGTYRPYDDPTWRDPHWWRYNILRHRYLEPLHPDEFVEGGRFTETLMALTGIPSSDVFFDERNRAIREVAQRLRQQLLGGEADEALRHLALEEVYRPLQTRPAALALLAIAATFDDVFPRALLLEIAAVERLQQVEEALHYLTVQRYLLTEKDSATLGLSPVLQAYVYKRQPQRKLRRRHRLAAQYFEGRHEPLRAAEHWQKGEKWSKAADLLLAAAGDLINELQIAELRDALLRFKASHLPAGQWREVQILLSDIYYRSGQYEEALAACRRALKAAEAEADQARIYRRMGKLYEKHNQLHALAYYEQAAERFGPDDAELVALLKDRGWVYILRKEWDKAEADLNRALAHTPDTAEDARADIYDALASLNRYQKQYEAAIDYARRALALREELGNLPRVADSFNNLGLLYTAMQAHEQAIAAYEEAMDTYARLGNRERTAMVLINMGMAHHLAGRLQAAVELYRQCLALCQEIGLPHVEAKTYSNLAEAEAELGHEAKAHAYWQRGYELSRLAGFEDQIAYFLEIRASMPLLQSVPLADEGDAEEETAVLPPAPAGSPLAQLDPDEQAALDIAGQEGQVTARALIDTADVSKATASRKLANLVELGYLEKRGAGRGTHYVLVARAGGLDGEPAAQPAVDWRAVVQILRRQKRLLAERYNVAALGVVEPESSAAAGPLNLRARFTIQPDLTTFFQLEEQVAAVLNTAVDLKPDPSLSPESEGRIVWI